MTAALIRQLVFAFALTAPVLAVQSSADAPPTFDIVSVKANRGGDTAMRLDVEPGGRLVVSNIPLKEFIRAAYALQAYQIADAPAWTESERFDVTAVSE